MRNNYRLTVFISLLLVGASALAVAVPPAYTGPMGNPEEPAMRPLKWLWHGVKAFGYRSVNGLRNTRQDERVRTLVKGTGVGVFQGSVELVESVGQGTIHAVPPSHGDYKELGKLNARIRQWEPLQGKEAGKAGESGDAGAPDSVPPPPSAADAETGESAAAMTGEEHTAPAASPEPAPEEGTAPEEPAAAGEAHRARWPVATWQWENDDPAPAPAEETLSSVERAQRRYIGERAQLNEHNDGRGNLLRLGR